LNKEEGDGMTRLKELIKIGLNKSDAKSVMHASEMYWKHIKRENNRKNNVLNIESKLPEPF
jgi:hypothetical protein